jgi:hypothetical protein
MRLNKYLGEAEEGLESINKTIALIKKDCGPFLKELSKSQKGKYLLRGIKRSLKTGNLPIEKVIPRKDRMPSDVPQEVHNYVDDKLNDMFGWKPRSAGVFVSSSFLTASNFGMPMIFFPIGKYRYVFMPGVEDWLPALENAGVVSYVGKWRIETTITRGERERRIDKLLKQYISNKQLKKAIINQDEMIFDCKAYYLIDTIREETMHKKLEEEIWR